MHNREIEEFAKILVRHVRDAAVRDCDMNRRPHVQSVTAKRWRQSDVGESGLVAETIIPDCVDEAVFFLLNAIDHGVLRLQFVATNGAVVDLTTEGLGELAGWYIGTDGWRSMYSEERFADFAGDDEGESG